jgi:hypothetical protein
MGEDYHLMDGSPAIDACAVGLPLDLDDIPRPFGSGYDMGAYESAEINLPPVADAGSGQSVTLSTAVTLDGSSSSDPDGDYPLTYFWSQTGGTPVSFTPTLSRTTFTAPAASDVLTFTLTVTDSLGLADPIPDMIVITVVEASSSFIFLPLVLRQ